MREAIGGAWLFQIVIFFVLLFAGYLALSINISKAYKVKSEVIDIIEREKGMYGTVNEGSFQSIKNYLDKVGYRTTGSCPDDESDWVGMTDTSFVHNPSGDNYYLCAKKIIVYRTENKGETPYTAYYRIKVFYHLDLPIIGGMFGMGIAGDTAPISYPRSDV